MPEHLSCQHCYGTVPYSTQTVAAACRHGKGALTPPRRVLVGFGWLGEVFCLLFELLGFFVFLLLGPPKMYLERGFAKS